MLNAHHGTTRASCGILVWRVRLSSRKGKDLGPKIPPPPHGLSSVTIHSSIVRLDVTRPEV
eukprot:scaffold7660_cov78-Skeletonema_menzelii.AAC.1